MSQDTDTRNPETGSEANSSPSKRKSCLLTLAVLLFVVGPLLLLLLNGPGFRTISKAVALHLASEQGLSGDLSIKGTIWSGVSIENLKLEGKEPDDPFFEIERLSVGYSALEALRDGKSLRWLERIEIQNANVVIPIPEGAEEAEPEKVETPTKPEPTRYSPLWSLLDAAIQIENVSVTLLQDGKRTTIADLSLLSPRGENGEFTVSKIEIPGQPPIEGLDVTLIKGDRSLTLGPLEATDYLTLEALTVAEPEIGVFTASVALDAAGGKLNATVNNTGQVSLQQEPDSQIDLSKITLRGETPVQLEGIITDCQLQFRGDFETPATWSLQGQLLGDGLGTSDASTDSVALTISNEDLRLEVSKSKASLELAAKVPFRQAQSIDQLASLPLFANASLEVPSLSDLLEGFEALPNDLPLRGGVTLDIANVQLGEGTTLHSGNLQLLTSNLEWDGIYLSGCELAANVTAPNQAQFAADLGLGPANRLRALGNFDLTDLSYRAEAKAHLDTDGELGLVLAALEKEIFRGKIAALWSGNGNLKKQSHEGSGKVELTDFILQNGLPIAGALHADYDGSKVHVPKLSLTTQQAELSGTADWDGIRLSLPDWTLVSGERAPLRLAAEIPLRTDHKGAFLEQPGAVSIQLETNALRPDDVTHFFSETPPTQGTLNGQLAATGTFEKLAATGEFSFLPTGEFAKEDSQVSLSLKANGNTSVPETWTLDLEALLSGFRYGEIDLETISLQANTEGQNPRKLLLADLAFQQSSSTLNAKAALGLSNARNFTELTKRPLLVNGALVIERLEEVLADFAPQKAESLPLSGTLNATVSGLEILESSLRKGTIQVRSDALALTGQRFKKIDLDAVINEPDQVEAELAIELDSETALRGNGIYQLAGKTYEGELGLSASLAEGKLNAILSGSPAAQLIPRSTDLNWKGGGDLTENTHEGELRLDANHLVLATGAEPLDVTIQGRYSETTADFPEVSIASDPIDITGTVRWQDNLLSLANWSGTRNGREVLALAASLPLDPEALTADSWFTQDIPLSLQLKTDALPLAAIASLAVPEVPVSGDITLDVQASGTPARPILKTDLLFDKISVAQEDKDLPVGRLQLGLNAAGEQAKVAGTFQHPDIQPLEIEARLPFHPGPWANKTRKILDESIFAAARMEESSLAFLPSQVPGIESIEDTVALDVAVKGPLSKPSLTGNGYLDLQKLKMEDRNIPSLTELDLDARFAENRLILERLYAIVAGGVIEGRGEALLQAGEDPRLNFKITGEEVLVFRNPDVNVRTDADISIAGPWSQLNIAGELGITNSRFFKNFDLLPIGLPRRNKSVLPTVERTPRGGGAAYTDLNLGVDAEPFRNWGIDMRIYTKDPFLVRSNLVESALTTDLRISGTLERPTPIGVLELQEGELSLPFSSVDVEVGRVEFDRETGFNGALEFKARAKADKYRANIYLFNNILSPKYVLTSNPPLPSEDILTLLTTGSVRSDLIGDDAGSVAASKAASLFLKNLRKTSAAEDKERGLLDELEERSELEFGGVNPETGEQTLGGKIRLWKQLFFVGDVDSQSDYRALLKYVFRFR